MPLPNSGYISLSMIAAEFKPGVAPPYYLSQFYGVAPGVPTSGLIKFSDFYGKSNEFIFNMNTSLANPNIRQLAINAGWNQSAKLIVNINADINTINLTAGLSFPGGIRLNILAGRRVGGVCGNYNYQVPRVDGGPAIFTRVPVEINNLGTLSGGGGRGGRGSSNYVQQSGVSGSAGRTISKQGLGGDGQGYLTPTGTTVFARTDGYYPPRATYSGDVIGGTASWVIGGKGNFGGNWGEAGFPGLSDAEYGGAYSNSGVSIPAEAGGLAGAYVDGNAYVTWVATGTRLGRVI